LGQSLAIPDADIYAVDIHFDHAHQYAGFDTTSPLIYNDGKRVIIEKLNVEHQRLIHIGDGLTDAIARDLVTRFIGYGGVFYRENIASISDYYIKVSSTAPLLALSLTNDEVDTLTKVEKDLYQKGLEIILNDQ